MPIQHNIKIAGETYTNIDSLQMNGANSEEGKTIEYICPEWDNLSFDDTTPILGTHTTDKDGFKTVTIESDDLNAANIIESATIFGVEGAIPVNEDADITVDGNELTVPAGYYPNEAQRTVADGTLTLVKSFDAGKFTALAKVTKNGYLTSADSTSAEIQLDTANANTIYPSTIEQVAVPANRYTLGEIKVAAMEYASGSLGGDAYNGKATPDIRYDSVEGIKTTKPSGSDFITIGASVRTEPAGYAPKYNVLQAGYIGTSLYADKETIPVTAEEDKVIYIETDDGTTVTPSTEEQTIALTGKLMQGDVVVEAMPEGTLADIELNNNNGTIEASLSISKPGYVDNTDRKTAELTLPAAQLTWNVGTVSGGCEAKITNQDNIRTVSANHDGDYYTIKATAIGNDGEAGLDVTKFTAGYLSTNPIENSSYVGVPVASDTIGKEIHIPKATLSTSGATVSVTEAGYLPAGESQTVQSGAYKANANANAQAKVSATGGSIVISTQPTLNPPNSGHYFKVTGIANATATSTAQITTAGYLNTGDQSTQDTDSQEATAYYTIPDGKVEINDDKIEFNAIVNGEVQTGDYGLPYYKIEVQQGSENTSVSATVTQSGYVAAGETIDTTPLEVAVSGAVFQSQIADPRSITNATADATIGYQQEVQIGAGYYPYSRVVKNGVQAIDRAQTTLTSSKNTTNNTLDFTASNNQGTGYVTGANKTATKSVSLSASGATVTATDGTNSISKTVASGRAQTPTTEITVTPIIEIDEVTNIATITVAHEQSITPTVSAGYISRGTSGIITISGSNTIDLGRTNYTLTGRWRLDGNRITDAVFNDNTETIRADNLVFGVYSDSNYQLMPSVVGMRFEGAHGPTGAILYYGSTAAYYTSTSGFNNMHFGWQGENWGYLSPTTIDILGTYTVNEKFYNWFTSVATRIDNSEFNTCTLRMNGTSYFGYGFDGVNTYNLSGETDNTIMCGAPLLLQEGMGNEVPELLSVYNYTLGYTVNLQRMIFYPRAEGQPLSVYTIPMEYKNMTLELLMD